MVSNFRITHKTNLALNSFQEFAAPLPVPSTPTDAGGLEGNDSARVLVNGDGMLAGIPAHALNPAATPAPPKPFTTATATVSSFTINLTYDTSVATAPAGFKAAMAAAVQYLQNQFSDPVSINIAVGYGEVGGHAMAAGALGNSLTYLTSTTYTQLSAALRTDAKTATDTSAVASLPASNPTGGTYWVSTAQAKALSLAGASSQLDGYVGFSASNPFDYTTADGITPGQYDFYGTALHELSEVMGRMMLTGGTIGSTGNSNYLLDLFHYSAAGTRSFSSSRAGYFSVDGGASNLGGFNTNSGGDAGDWGGSLGNDSFNAFSAPGVINALSPSDLMVLDTIGWNRTTAPAANITIRLTNDTGASTTDRLTNDATLSGTAPANAVVTISEGGVTLGTATADTKGAWSFKPVTLAEGSHTIAAAVGANGQTSRSTLEFTYDTTAPLLTIGLAQDTGTSSRDHITANTALTGTAEAGNTVKLLDGGKLIGTVVAGSDGTWSFSPKGLAVGIHKIVASALDSAGNSGSAALPMAYATAEPTGATLAQATVGIGSADARGVLAKGLVLATVSRAGGLVTDSYSFVLGGANAAEFKLTASKNIGTLTTGTAPLAGDTAGRAYALSVSAVDTTIGFTAPALDLSVIVSTDGNDTIRIGTLLSNPSVPAFVYGLGGNDIITASGATGPLHIDGGAGADSMTGGSGADTYIYGAATESTPTAMDIITNFDPAADLIDLTGLGRTLKWAGEIGPSGTIGAGMVGWQQSGATTYIIVNTSTKATPPSSASMEIALTGQVPLAAANILHL